MLHDQTDSVLIATKIIGLWRRDSTRESPRIKYVVGNTVIYFVPFASSESSSELSHEVYIKSLILAQDERWRRG